MKFFLKLEKKYYNYAISGLTTYIAIIGAIGVFVGVFAMRSSDINITAYALNPIMVLKGQIWRLFTYHLNVSDDIFSFINILFLYFMGKTVEKTIGKFRMNVYILLNIIFYFIAGIITYYFDYFSYVILYITPNNMHIFLALMLLYAMFDPDTVILLYFIIPIKLKYMILLYYVFMAITFIKIGLIKGVITFIVCLLIPNLISIVLYKLMFYGKITNNFEKKKIFINKNEYEKFKKTISKIGNKEEENNKDVQKILRRPIHKCHICGKTDVDDPNLEFRYCSKCEGEYEYCKEHLYTHIHVKK